MDDTRKACAPRARCNNWRDCRACARIRQARFATRAENAAKWMAEPTFYVLVPEDTTPAGIEYARRYFVRQARPVAGVWSIEKGEFRAGYHLNVIADRVPMEGRFKGHIYAEPIRTNVRAVAAYITKAQRAATRDDGFARATGDFGKVSDWMKSAERIAPVVAAAAHQVDLDDGYLPPEVPGPERPQDTTARWLAPLRAAAPPSATPPKAPRAARAAPPPPPPIPAPAPAAPEPDQLLASRYHAADRGEQQRLDKWWRGQMRRLPKEQRRAPPWLLERADPPPSDPATARVWLDHIRTLTTTGPRQGGGP